jgi:phenylacetic acid degradation operon negative regulatory protein
MPGADDLGVRPFNARSLALSVLLGLPEPRLAAAPLVQLAAIFGMAEGTMRTALSRLVAGGELTADGGVYSLSGRLLERKSAQDLGRTPPPARWDGAWWSVTVLDGRRTVAQRRELRTHMANGRMGEVRPEAWLRPANTPAPTAPGAAVVRGSLSGVDRPALVERLWDLRAVAARAELLGGHLATAASGLRHDGAVALPAAMSTAAATVRFLREEPYLPAALTPDGWPVDDLRRRYRSFDRSLGAVLARAVDLR